MATSTRDQDNGPAAATENGDGHRYTIDELATASGVPSRTIRFYQSKGTLPPPERRGRIAYYGPEHLERLQVIAELQDRGLRLDAIRDALDEIGRGGTSLQEWLGMGDELQAPWSDDHPVVLTEAEMAQHFGTRPGLIPELCRSSFIERTGDSRPATYLFTSSALLEIAIDLHHAGIDPVVVFDAGELMRRRLGRLTDDLVEFFASRAGQGFADGGQPEEIARSSRALRPLGMRALQVIFAHEVERSVRELIETGGALPTARRVRPTEEPRPERESAGRRASDRPRGEIAEDLVPDTEPDEPDEPDTEPDAGRPARRPEAGRQVPRRPS